MADLRQPDFWISRLYPVLFVLLPWSFECPFGSWKLLVPSEPLIAALGICLGWFALKKNGAMRALFSNNHLLWTSAAWIGWLGVSAVFSTMPVVSWKYWVVEAGQWWVFAAGFSWFPNLWKRALRLFAFSMAGVVVYTMAHHSFFQFRADQALLAPMPFFSENTVYGAVLGMVIFALFTPGLFPSGNENRNLAAADRAHIRAMGDKTRTFLLILFFTGLIFSFCRAAVLSVMIATIVGILLIAREKWRLVAMAALFLFASAIFFPGKDFNGIRNDVSSLERLNRYACSLRMAYDRPWTGFGPGTYQFQYIPYQKADEMTRISATAPVLERSQHTYGRGGGVHSEYLQALAETGWTGLVLWITWAATVLWCGFSRAVREKSTLDQQRALALTLCLLTFFLHALVNNLLHDGRTAALVWSGVALLSMQVRAKAAS